MVGRTSGEEQRHQAEMKVAGPKVSRCATAASKLRHFSLRKACLLLFGLKVIHFIPGSRTNLYYGKRT